MTIMIIIWFSPYNWRFKNTFAVHFWSNKRLARSLAYNSFCVLVYVINVHDCVLSQFSNGTRNNINGNYLIFKLFLSVIPDITPHTSMRIHRNQSMVTMMRSAQEHRKLIKSALFICLIRERNNASLKVFSARLPLLVRNSLVCSFQILLFYFSVTVRASIFQYMLFFGYWCCCFFMLCFVIGVYFTLATHNFCCY